MQPLLESAFAYSRFSTPQQAEGDSLRRQRARAEEWARANGRTVEYLHDEGRSAFRGSNRTLGQLGLFIERLRVGQLGKRPLLLIENFDRLSREQLSDAQALFLELINSGARLVTLHNGRSYQRPLGVEDAIVAILEMNAAHQYAAAISDRVSKEWAAARQRAAGGQIIHRRAPLWLKLDKRLNVFEPIPARVRLLQSIFQRYVQGESPEKIAISLNQKGVKLWGGWSKNNGLWHSTRIRALLFNPAVAGTFQPCRIEGRKRVPDGAPIKGYFPQVIDSELFQMAQRIQASRASGPGKPANHSRYLTRGFTFSEVDGSRMTYRRSDATRRDRLVSMKSRLGVTVPQHGLVYAEFENRLLELLNKAEPGLLRVIREAGNTAAELESTRVEQQEREAEKQIKKYARLIRMDDTPSPTLVKELRRAEASLTEASRLKAALAAEARTSVRKPEIAMDDLKTEEGRIRVRGQIAGWCDRITVSRSAITVWITKHEGFRALLVGEATPKLRLSRESSLRPLLHDILQTSTVRPTMSCPADAERDKQDG